MERQAFRYHGGGLFLLVGAGVTQYAAIIEGFRSWKPTGAEPRIVQDYSEWYKFDFTGLGPPTPIGVTVGKINFEGWPDDNSVHGSGVYASLGGGISTGFDHGEGLTYYSSMGLRHYQDYRLPPDAHGRVKVNRAIIADISHGSHTPWIWPNDNRGIDRWLRQDYYAVRSLTQAAIYVYEQINYCSYGPGQSAKDSSKPPQ